MPIFEYKAINDLGKTVTGTMEAGYPGAVSEYLSKQNYMPLKIIEKKGRGIVFSLRRKVKREEVITFTKQMVTLLKAGVPIISSLEALSEQTDNPTLKETINRIREDLEAGSNFSNSLSKYPDVFNELYVNTVRAGETGGVLDQVLFRLGSLMTYEEEIKSKLKGAIRYPIIVITLMIVAFTILMTFVVPKFVDVFAQAGAELPLPTKILLNTSNVIKNYWYLVFGTIFALIILFFVYVKTPSGKIVWDRVKLKFPVFGSLFLKTSMSRFAHMFETLNKSGLPILQTLEIVSKTIGNAYIGRELEKVGQNIEKGRGISKPLQESKLFPPLVIRMIAVGEQSGALDEMLKNVSEHYDSEVNYMIENLVALIEPMLTVSIGAMVLLLALGIFLPMWNIMSAARGF
jgi:type IV pilus assembly protein PilC